MYAAPVKGAAEVPMLQLDCTDIGETEGSKPNGVGTITCSLGVYEGEVTIKLTLQSGYSFSTAQLTAWIVCVCVPAGC